MAIPVLVSVNSDQSRLENAQVAFVDGQTWTIIGLGWRMAGHNQFALMPEVKCPVVDLSKIISDDDLISLAINRYMLPHNGVSSLEGLLIDLKYLGASVSYSHCNEA